MAGKQRWLPLESNPDVLNKYAYDIGVPSTWKFVDVYCLDEDMLGVVQQPVISLILLFPTSDNTKKYEIGTVNEKKVAYFTKQTIGNACGTVAMIHSLANNTSNISFLEDKPFSKFLSATKTMTPDERATYLETDLDMGSAHSEHAQEGQTKAPSADASVRNHFVSLVMVDGELVELNGAQTGPVVHGQTTNETFLKDAVGVVRKYMERDPGEVNFTVMALVPS